MFGAVKSPTAQVNITKDITRGFINKINDFKNKNKFREPDFLLRVLLATLSYIK